MNDSDNRIVAQEEEIAELRAQVETAKKEVSRKQNALDAVIDAYLWLDYYGSQLILRDRRMRRDHGEAVLELIRRLHKYTDTVPEESSQRRMRTELAVIRDAFLGLSKENLNGMDNEVAFCGTPHSINSSRQCSDH